MYNGLDNPFILNAIAANQPPGGMDPRATALLGALAGYQRPAAPPQPAIPPAFEGLPAFDAMPGGVTEAPAPAASGSAPWGMLTDAQGREEVAAGLPEIDREVARRKEELEQARRAEAPLMFMGVPIVSAEEGAAAAESQYAEARAREKHAEAQLAGDAPLPTTTPARNFAETAYQSAARSIGDVPRFAGYIGGWLASEAGAEAAPTDNSVFALGQNIDDWARTAFPGDEARAEEFGTKAANLAGFLATLYGAGGLKAMTEGGPLLAEKIGAAASAGSQAGLAAAAGGMGQFEGATQAMEGGADVSERDRAIATLLGAGVGLSYLIPLASSLAVPAEREAGAVMAEALKGSGVTASQMAGFNVMNNAIAKTFYDPERSLSAGLGEDVALGALAGGLTHGGGALARRRLSTPEELQDFISRAKGASGADDAGLGDYFDGMRDWVNANIPRLPRPAEGGEAAPATPEPSPEPAPSGTLRGQEGALKEWVADVYGDEYRGEVSPDGKTLAIVGPEGKKLITYQPEDLDVIGATGQAYGNIKDAGPYALGGDWREEAHANRRLSEGTGESPQREGAQDQGPSAEVREGRDAGGSSQQSEGAGGPGGALRDIGSIEENAPDAFSFKNVNTDFDVTATRVEPSDGKLNALRIWANPRGAAQGMHGPAAKVLLEQRPDGRWEVSWMNARKDFRGGNRGSELINNLYDAIERQYGITMIPSGHLTEGGYGFWSGRGSWPGRNPELTKYHQLVEGDAWHSPRYIKSEIDWAEKQIEHLDPVKHWDEIQTIQKDMRPWVEAFENVPGEGKTPEALEAQFALRGFYRPDIQALAEIKQDKATGQQWRAMLGKAPGAKRWLDLIGFDDWAEKQKGALTKQDVQDFLQANDVEIKERTLGKIPEEQNEAAKQELAMERYGAPWDKLSLAQQSAVLQDVYRKFNSSLAKYEGHKIEGGENYREILITLPSLEGKWDSPHFRDQEVLHMRVDDRQLPEGGRVLFLHELQSDLHQRGRESGYRTKASDEEIQKEIDERYHTDLEQYYNNDLPKYKEAVDALEKADDEYIKTLDKTVTFLKENTDVDERLDALGYNNLSNKYLIGLTIVTPESSVSEKLVPLKRWMLETVPNEYVSSLVDSNKRISENSFIEEPVEPNRDDIAEKVMARYENKVPDAPFKGDWWWEIGLKNLLRKAVEEGYDAVALPHSAQIEDVVGAEAGSLSVFYDQKIPRFFEKYAKRLGGRVDRELIVERHGYSPYLGMQGHLRAIAEDPGYYGLSAEQGAEAHELAKRYRDVVSRGESPRRIADLMSPGLRQVFDEQFFNPRSNLVVHITPEMRERIAEKGQPLAQGTERVIKMMETALKSGKAVTIPDAFVEQVHQALAPVRQVVPESVGFHTLSRIQPRDDGALDAIFTAPSGKRIAIIADSFRDLQELRGLCLEDGGDILIFDLGAGRGEKGAAPSRAGEVGADARAGVALHESVHSLSRQGRIGGEDWGRFVDHANSLGVMDMPLDAMLSAIGESPAGFDLSLREAYALQYQNLSPEARNKLLTEEEPVAHMVELFHHKHYSGDQMQPIADLLEKLLSGHYATERNSE